ncbi:MAG: hypothetical protein V1779_06340 [bacterium]
MKQIIFLSTVFLIVLMGCQNYRTQRDKDVVAEIEQSKNDYDIRTSKSVVIPDDGSGPIAGFSEVSNPDVIITFSELGVPQFVENGKTANFIYEGVDPDDTYIMYESYGNGYNLTLRKKDDRVGVKFEKLCQLFIVGNPSLTSIRIPDNLKYEQIIWTPRTDGTWELRIGTTERGCKSKSLDELQKMRNKSYEGNVPK